VPRNLLEPIVDALAHAERAHDAPFGAFAAARLPLRRYDLECDAEVDLGSKFSPGLADELPRLERPERRAGRPTKPRAAGRWRPLRELRGRA
jgi:hypothetical protein